jgi:hypothetical protein
MAGRKKPVIALPPKGQAVDPSTSQDICVESLTEVADVIGATTHYGASLGREVLYCFGNKNECKIRVWIEEDGSGFRVVGSKTDGIGNNIAVTDTEDTDGIDSDACKLIMYRLAFDLPKIDDPNSMSSHTHILNQSSAYEWRDYGFTGEEYETWRNTGIMPVDALDWLGAGFTPEDAQEWNKNFNVTEAHSWREAGFEAKSASEWYDECSITDDAEYSMTPERAKKWREVISDPAEAGEWIMMFGFDPDKSREWREHGFTPAGAEYWSEFLDPKAARARLDADAKAGKDNHDYA